MKMKHPLAAVAAVALMTSFGASSASASTITILIDDFTDFQAVSDLPTLDRPTASHETGNMIGGVRYLKVETTAVLPPLSDPEMEGPFDPQSSGTTLIAEQGGLTFNNATRSVGKGWAIYDGTDTRVGPEIDTVAGLSFGASVNTTGLNADLLQGFPTGFFRFSGVNFDQPGTIFKAFAWDMDFNEVSYREELIPQDFSAILGYDEFRSNWDDPASGLGGFDWGRVGALAFRVESRTPAFDGDIGAITAHPIPLPAAAFLLLGGLGGLAGISFVGKRRRKS